MKNFLKTTVASLLLTAALATPSFATDVKIGDTFTSYDSQNRLVLHNLTTQELCSIKNGVQITVLDIEGDLALVSTNNNPTGPWDDCPADEILKTSIYVLEFFEKDKQKDEIEAAQIQKMLDRLKARATQAE